MVLLVSFNDCLPKKKYVDENVYSLQRISTLYVLIRTNRLFTASRGYLEIFLDVYIFRNTVDGTHSTEPKFNLGWVKYIQQSYILI